VSQSWWKPLYKLYAFNGHVACVHVYSGRFTSKFGSALYLPDKWTRVKGAEFDLPGKVAKPKSLNKMIKWAKRLSVGIPFVRVDFYDTQKGAVFGECATYPGRGHVTLPDALSRSLGQCYHKAARELGLYLPLSQSIPNKPTTNHDDEIEQPVV